MPKSIYKGLWCWLYTTDSEHAMKAKIVRTIVECGHDAYFVMYEDRTTETIFASTINRIVPVQPKKGRLVDFAKRRAKLKVLK